MCRSIIQFPKQEYIKKTIIYIIMMMGGQLITSQKNIEILLEYKLILIIDIINKSTHFRSRMLYV